MNEMNWFGLAGVIVVIFVCIGALKSCDYEHESELKCIEKTGDKHCGQFNKAGDNGK